MRRSNPNVIRYVRRLKLPWQSEFEEAVRSAAGLYNAAMHDYWRIWNKHGVQAPAQSCLMVLHKSAPGLHSHSADCIVADFYDDLMAWGKQKRADSRARSPTSSKEWHPVKYGSPDSLRIRDGNLILSNGRSGPPFVIQGWKHELPKQAILRKAGQGFELVCVYQRPRPDLNVEGDIAGVDLGEAVMCAVHTAEEAYLVNGKLLRSLQHAQRRTVARFNGMLARVEPGSRRYLRLMESKRRQLKHISDQIRDLVEKQTTLMMNQLAVDGVSTLAIGDVKDIRRRTKFGPRMNARLHSWKAGKVRRRLEQKAAERGINTTLVDEHYTSQTCLECGARTKCRGRTFICSQCHASFHRDIVGAYSIRLRAINTIGSDHVAAVSGPTMSPLGLRYKSSASCSPRKRETRATQCVGAIIDGHND